MTINFTDPILTHLLNLLTTCGWRDMMADDMRALAKRAHCAFNYGASKGVYISDAWDFVIKVPLFAEHDIETDYCALELDAYKKIVTEYPACACLFAPIKFLGWFGEIPVYAQDKVYISFKDFYFEKEKSYNQLKDEAYAIRDNDIEFFNEFYGFVSGSHLSVIFYYLIGKIYGCDTRQSFRRWVIDTYQNDLHNSNVGLTKDNKPIIFDFSGFNH